MRTVLHSSESELVSGNPYWPVHNRKTKLGPRLETNVSCRLAIIGGGITGALMAHHAVQDGIDTVLIDRGLFGGGSTSASTAMVGYEFDLLLVDLAEKIGNRAAARVYELCYEATSSFKGLVRHIESPCDYDDKQSIRITDQPSDIPKFEREAQARHRLGFKLEVVDRDSLEKRFGLRAEAGLVGGNSAQIDPFNLTRRLIKSASMRGLRAFEQTKATVFESGKQAIRIKTTAGPTIEAERVVFATGYESEKHLGRKIAELTTDFCFISHPLKSLGKLEKCHVVENADRYFYLSTFGNRVMVGVESGSNYPPAARSRLTQGRTDRLLQRVLPVLAELNPTIEYRWAGTFANSPDSLPFLGEVRRLPGALFLLGYGGNGIASSATLAPIALDWVKGRTNPDSELFRLDR